MWHSDEYRIRDAADVHAVLGWADESARADQAFTLYVECLCDDSWGLIQLAGVDPTANP